MYVWSFYILVIANEQKADSESEDDSDVEEEALKNVVSSRGKFASFLQMRNSMIESGDPHRASVAKKDKALHHASIILKRTLTHQDNHHHNEDAQFLVNPKDAEKVIKYANE